MLRCGSASSIAMVMACGITEHFLEKHLTHVSWKDPAEKNLEAMVDLRLNISLSLLSFQSQPKPIVEDTGKGMKEPQRVLMWASQFKKDAKKLERPGGGLPTWSWSWCTLHQQRWRGLGWVSLATRR